MEDGTASSTRPDESAAPALAGTDPTSFPEPAQIPRGELAKRMGIVVTEATPERMVATMPVEGNRQPFGLLHGGASAVLAESVVLGLAGGVLGGSLAYVAFNGYQASTLNWQTFSQVAFAFRVTPPLLVQGTVYALLLGLFGGIFPAFRAARIPVASALREL